MIVDGTVPGGPERTYLRDEMVEILGRTSLGEAAQAEVLTELDRYAQERELARQEAEFTGGIIKLAIIYERVEGEGASDCNIEGWYEELETQSENVLRSFVDRQRPSQTENLARNLAALLYVGLNRQAGSELDLALLLDAGLDEGELLERCRGALVEAAVDQGMDTPDVEQRVRERYPTLRSIPAGIVPHIWDRLIKPMATEFRASLLAAGHDLPELNDLGLYLDEDEESSE